MSTLQNALSALKGGKFVLLHDGDGRENEADLLLLAEKATPAHVRTLRKDAGGLICLATDKGTAKRLGLEFATDMLAKSCSPTIARMGRARMKYGDMPAFTISINHLGTFTGIPDNDRALTMREFGKLVKSRGTAREFAKSFRAIGHVFLLAARGLEARRGHTELSVELARMAGCTQAVVLCEMLSDTGRAASKQEAISYARRHKIPFIEGKQVLEAHYGKGK
ncbi:MAG: 3,4-dihydroxy-2-butanone-4-phosphate synthase [Candidatus Micrarchaeia archaeon]|jgi:3,4-dihydroxy 2-butanone 4-phosphate synthase